MERSWLVQVQRRSLLLGEHHERDVHPLCRYGAVYYSIADLCEDIGCWAPVELDTIDSVLRSTGAVRDSDVGIPEIPLLAAYIENRVVWSKLKAVGILAERAFPGPLYPSGWTEPLARSQQIAAQESK